MAQIPNGLIALWSGRIANIPSGWALCDGTNGTPDLRNRFVVCADADTGPIATTTLTGAATQNGGSITHNHTVNNPAHTHTITDPGHIHAWSSESQATAGSDIVIPIDGQTLSSTTGITVDSAATAVTTNGVSAPQPYFALAYIMKL